MATITQIIDAKWYSQIKNGDDFTLLTGDFSRNLVGNIFESVKLEATVRTFTTLNIGDPWYATDSSISSVNIDFTTSVSVGDICRIIDNPSVDLWEIQITSVEKTIIYFNELQRTGGETLPHLYVSGDDVLVVTTDLTFLKYDHGLVNSSSGATSYRSKLDDETTSFLCEGLGIRTDPADPLTRQTAFVDGEATTLNSNTGSFKAKFLEFADIPFSDVGGLEGSQDFDIEHIFKIQDYSEEDITNYINNTKPDAYLGENTLNYNSKFEFRTVSVNPETSKVGTYLNRGNVGFFNENLNGRPNKYTFSTPVITRSSTGETLDDIANNEESTVTFTISGTGTPFAAVPVIVLNHFAMISNYEFKTETFDDLFKNELLRIEGVSTETGTIFTEGKITGYTDTTIDVEFKINPNDANLEDEQYILSVLVGDSSTSNINPDKVQLNIKTGTYQSGFDVTGLLGDVSIELFQRDCDPYTETGVSSFSIISGELIYTKLLIPVLDGTIDSIALETIDFYNGDIEVVDTLEIDTSTFVVIDDEQEIQTELPTPYSSGLNGYIRKVSTGLYEVIFPYRMPFDKLRAVSGLNSVLFDQDEPNQGLNESAYYQTTKGVNVHIAFKIGMFAENRVTLYRYRTPAITINDFENTL